MLAADGVVGLEGCFMADRSGWDATGAYIFGALSLYVCFVVAVVINDETMYMDVGDCCQRR